MTPFDEGAATEQHAGSRGEEVWRVEKRDKEEEGGNREDDVNMKLEQTLQAEPTDDLVFCTVGIDRDKSRLGVAKPVAGEGG